MKVTVTTLGDAIYNLDVNEDLELENFKAFCELESGIPANEILLVLNGRPLTDDKKSLKDLGVKNDDVLILQQHKQSQAISQSAQNSGSRPATAPVPIDFSTIQIPMASSSRRPQSTNRSGNRPSLDQEDPAVIRDALLKDPQQLALIKQNNPSLAKALLSGDFEKFSKMIKEMQKEHIEREAQRIRLLTADQFDAEAQKLIADQIKQKNIDANMEAAMEYNPESFGTVVMLYINLKVNGFPVKAFIDSGAQTTIMSVACAERCNIMRLVDTRFSGIAKGVGTQKIIGRIHMVQIQIGNDFFTSSFSILEDQKMDMLLGLDMLRRHECVIDLKEQALKIGTTGTSTPFLPEGELPESARLTNNRSESHAENEAALEQLGGEDIGLAKAIEDSMKDTPGSSVISGTQMPSGNNTGSNATIPIVPTQTFSEELIQEIVKLGFTRNDVIFELGRFNGDKTQAIAALFAKSLKF